jgi:hypothetical protein
LLLATLLALLPLLLLLAALLPLLPLSLLLAALLSLPLLPLAALLPFLPLATLPELVGPLVLRHHDPGSVRRRPGLYAETVRTDAEGKE